MLGTKCLSVFVVLALCSFAFAADEKQMSDQDFVKDAAIGGMFEVLAGKLATQKGSEQTRSFGAQMVADHGMAGDELKAIAEKKGMTLPTEVDAKHKEKLDKLAGLSGAEFDKHYIECMKKDHQEDLAKFKAASTSLQDADLKAFAAKTLQVVERHKQHIDGIKVASADLPPNNTALPPNNLPPADQKLADQSQRFDTSTNRFQDNNAQNSVGANVSQSTTTTQQSNTQFTTEQQFTTEPRQTIDAQYTESMPVQTFETGYDSGYGRRFYGARRGCDSNGPSLDSTPSWNQR
jgi:putative membrane protein